MRIQTPIDLNKTSVLRVYQPAQGYAPGCVYMLEGGQRGPLEVVKK
jgi:hypothetical protein